MRVEELVGQCVRDRREELGMSQPEFGQRLAHWLGRPWTRQAVSAAEQGKRAFTTAELFAIAQVLDTRPARLLAPPLNVAELELPSGAALPTRKIGDIGIADRYLSQMWDELADGKRTHDQASKMLVELGKALNSLEDKLTTVIAASEVSTMHSDRAQEREQ